VKNRRNRDCNKPCDTDGLNLRRLQRNWDQFGRTDPYWAILTLPGREQNRWDLDEFFASGRKEIEALMEYVLRIAPDLARGRVLDFGCGVGRLTRPLAEHFEDAVGVDIAPSMIERAREFARENSRCRFVLNERDDLRGFPSSHFDLVYSTITLQHMEPRYSLRYIREFVRILRPGGLVIFELTSRSVREPGPLRLAIGKAIGAILQTLPGAPPRMEMYCVPPAEVRSALESHGAQILDVLPDASAGPDYEGFRYCARRS
jgi:SAM-dependent methyltransferase